MSERGQVPLGRVTVLLRRSQPDALEYSCRLSRGDKLIDVRIVRRRRKTMALYVEKDRMPELRVPKRCAWREIDRFLCGRFDWILAAEDELARRKLTPANCYEQGGSIRFLGRIYPLNLVQSRHRVVDLGDVELYVACGNPGDPALVERQILGWYRRQAEMIFVERLAGMSRLFADERNPAGVRVRKMKARWGSCGSNSEICLNLLLIRESLPQIDFVVAHELCHLRHFHHNEAFYSLLTSVMPDWREREATLAMAG